MGMLVSGVGEVRSWLVSLASYRFSARMSTKDRAMGSFLGVTLALPALRRQEAGQLVTRPIKRIKGASCQTPPSIHTARITNLKGAWGGSFTQRWMHDYPSGLSTQIILQTVEDPVLRGLEWPILFMEFTKRM